MIQFPLSFVALSFVFSVKYTSLSTKSCFNVTMSFLNICREFICNFVYYYALVLGVATVRVDLQPIRWELALNKIVRISRSILNIIMIITAPIVIWKTMNLLHTSITNPLVMLVDTVQSYLQVSTFIGTILFYWLKENPLLELANRFGFLDGQFYVYSEKNEKLERFVSIALLNKFLCLFGQAFCAIYGLNILLNGFTWSTAFMAIYIAHMQNLIHGSMFYYYGLLIQVHKRFLMINEKIQSLLQSLEQVPSVYQSNSLHYLFNMISEDLRAIMLQHYHLTELTHGINTAYQYQNLVVLITYLTTNIGYGYNVVLVLDGSMNIGFTALSVIFGIVAYTGLFLDLYLFFWCCHITCGESYRTSWLLRRFSELKFQHAELEKIVCIIE